MSHRTIILALCGLVLLLLGVIVGQTLERSNAAEARVPANQVATQLAGNVDVTKRPQAALSTKEYWISTRELDATRIGFSAWAVLRPGGNLIVERCLAPDYAIPDKPGVALAPPIPKCESIVDGLVSQLSESQVVVRARDGTQRSFRYSLMRKGTAENLLLDVGKSVKLEPGSKNSLFERLQQLPADEEARNRYTRRMLGVGVARAPGAGTTAAPDGRVP